MTLDTTDTLKRQYEWVRGSRAVLLDYLEGLTRDELVEENSSFGRGSVVKLLIHTANTYRYWLGEQALGRVMTYAGDGSHVDLAAIRGLFGQVDTLVGEFVERFAERGSWRVEYRIGGREGTAEALRLFTHVVTHEYHHKGQVLSLTRHLGYTPVDTDVMR